MLKRQRIDFSQLAKGDVIDPEQIEAHTDVDVTSQQYPLAVLGLRIAIENWFRLHDDPVNTAAKQGSIIILTDEQGVEVTAGRFKASIKSMHRSYEQMNRTDTSQLTPESKSRHFHNLEVAGSVLSAVEAAQRHLPPDERPHWFGQATA